MKTQNTGRKTRSETSKTYEPSNTKPRDHNPPKQPRHYYGCISLMSETYPHLKMGAGLNPNPTYGPPDHSIFSPSTPDLAVAASANLCSDSLAVICAPLSRSVSFSSAVAFTAGFQLDGARGSVRRSLSSEVASSFLASTAVSSRRERVVNIVRWWLNGVTTPALETSSPTALLHVTSSAPDVVSTSRRSTSRRQCQYAR